MSEIVQGFSGMDEWREFITSHPKILSAELIEDIVAHARTDGVESTFLGPIGPEEISVADANYRESLQARGLNPRCRAVLELVAREPWFRDPRATIYAAEALTPFALVMRGRFSRFIGSEYVSSEAGRRALYPIAFEDLTKLTLPSDRFHCAITNDCLEHIPDIPACLSEIVRVLRPGGVMLSTFPFTYRQNTLVRARERGGAIEHLLQPEYHGNPAEPGKGSLVFQVPGWDILQTAREAGCSVAEMVFVSSIEWGITATDVAGIFVMRCYK